MTTTINNKMIQFARIIHANGIISPGIQHQIIGFIVQMMQGNMINNKIAELRLFKAAVSISRKHVTTEEPKQKRL